MEPTGNPATTANDSALSGGSAPELSDALANVAAGLRRLHLNNQTHAVDDAGTSDIFPPSNVRHPLPIVVDANVLFQDVAYSCHHNEERTTLINGANAGLFRLYMAGHVANEIDGYRHTKPTADKVDGPLWLRVWNRDYRPLIRLIEPIPENLLTADELERLAILREADPDDVPSATLALMLEAFLLSEDRRPNEAVYTPQAGAHDRLEWREQLRAGGNVGVISQLIQSTEVLGQVLGIGVSSAMRWIASRTTTGTAAGVALLGVGVAAMLVYRANPDTKAKYRGWISTLVRHLRAGLTLFENESAVTRALIPSVPSESDLEAELGRDAALSRRAMRTSAHARASTHSAVELNDAIHTAGARSSISLLRTSLRENPAFSLIDRGRWQLGIPSPKLEERIN